MLSISGTDLRSEERLYYIGRQQERKKDAKRKIKGLQTRKGLLLYKAYDKQIIFLRRTNNE